MTDKSDNILANLARVGVISSVDASKHMARVIFPDKKLVSGWLYVLQHFDANVSVEGGANAKLKYWMPKVNDRVLCLYVPVANGDGFILGGIP